MNVPNKFLDFLIVDLLISPRQLCYVLTHGFKAVYHQLDQIVWILVQLGVVQDLLDYFETEDVAVDVVFEVEVLDYLLDYGNSVLVDYLIVVQDA